MRHLVLGGTGTVGSLVVRGLLDKGETVRVLTRSAEHARSLPKGAEQPAWPGAVPGPAPARVHAPPVPAELLDGAGDPVTVSSRGEASAPPSLLRSAVLPGGGGVIAAWAGPWAHDLRWWDRVTRRRRALWQIVVRPVGSPDDDDGSADVACLVVLESGRAAIEAVYD